jgi:hypothetical protein
MPKKSWFVASLAIPQVLQVKFATEHNSGPDVSGGIKRILRISYSLISLSGDEDDWNLLPTKPQFLIGAKGRIFIIRSLQRIAKATRIDGASASSTTSAQI